MRSGAPRTELQLSHCRSMEHRIVCAADRGAERRGCIDHTKLIGNLEELVWAHGLRPPNSRTRDGEDDSQVATLLDRYRSVPARQEPVVCTAHIVAGRTRDRVEHDDLVTVVSELGRAANLDELGEAVAKQLDRAIHGRRRATTTLRVRMRVHATTIRATELCMCDRLGIG